MYKIFITTADIQILTGDSYSSAWRQYRACKDALDKKKHQKVTIKEYADYIGANSQEIIEALNPKK